MTSWPGLAGERVHVWALGLNKSLETETEGKRDRKCVCVCVCIQGRVSGRENEKGSSTDLHLRPPPMFASH